jgi:hypothetical protein
MTCLRLCSLLVFSAALATTVPVLAQGAPPAASAGGARPAPPPLTNIKALPKDISRDDLLKLMREYVGDLGVDCNFCHAQDPTTHRYDMASDANPMKDKARVMIAMTDAINTKYLAQLADHKDTDAPATCGTCHRGASVPTAFVPAPRQPRPAGTPPAAGAAPRTPH